MARRATHDVHIADLARFWDRPPRREPGSSRRVARWVGLTVIAGAAAAAPWYVVTRAPARPEPLPSAAVQSTPSVTPAPATGERYIVVGVDPCLRVRRRPSIEADRIACIDEGTRLSSDGRTVIRSERVWLHVRIPGTHRWGWGAAQFLDPVH